MALYPRRVIQIWEVKGMSEEKDWAEFYQQHKDDPEMWGAPEPSTSPARRGSLRATITVRFSPEEASEIRELAKKLDVTYSDVVRRAVSEFIRPRSFKRYRSAVRPESEDKTDFSFSSATTSTGSLV
jgi:crotonobetainyl-CoA:carnitine CoA-transferase CaiB-like acyl-CoA transferase